MFLWSSNFLFAWCILQNCLTACKKRSLYSSSSAGVLEAQLCALPTKSPKFYLHDVSSFWKEPTFIPTALWKNIQFLQSHSIFIKKLGKEEVEPNMIFFFWMLLHLAENWRMQLIFTFFVVIKNKGKNSTKIVSQGCCRWQHENYCSFTTIELFSALMNGTFIWY